MVLVPKFVPTSSVRAEVIRAEISVLKTTDAGGMTIGDGVKFTPVTFAPDIDLAALCGVKTNPARAGVIKYAPFRRPPNV
jgi:hypothetical protein